MWRARNAERVEDSAICSILCEELRYQLAMLPAQDIALRRFQIM